MSYQQRHQTRMQQAAYSFPLLTEADILQCMNDLEISLNPEELKTVPKEAVRRVLEQLIDMCMGIAKEEMNQPAFAGLSALSYPELHEDSIPTLAFFRAALKMMTVSGINDFSLKDITSPDPKRFRRQISGIINFAKFREERFAQYTELISHTDELFETRHRIEQENAELRKQLEELNSQNAAEAPALQQLDEQTKEAEHQIDELNKQQAVLRHKNNELKAQSSSLRDEIAGVQFSILNATEKCTTLKSQIVSSPDRIRKEIVDMNQSLAALKREGTDMRRREKSVSGKIRLLTRAEEDLTEIAKFMNVVQSDIQNYKTYAKEQKEKKNQIANCEHELEAHNSMKQTMQERLIKLNEKLSSQSSMTELKTEAAKQALMQARNELDSMKEEQQQLLSQAKLADDQIDTKENEMNQNQSSHRAEMEGITQKYQQMEEVVKNYNRGLCNVTNQAR